MTARSKAIEDIKEELKKESKSFLAFRTELNPVIKKITSEYIELQKKADESKANIQGR